MLPGVRTCAPFEEGVPPPLDRRVGCPPVGLGVKRGDSKKLREMGSLLGHLTAGFLQCDSETTKSFPRPPAFEGPHDHI